MAFLSAAAGHAHLSEAGGQLSGAVALARSKAPGRREDLLCRRQVGGVYARDAELQEG